MSPMLFSRDSRCNYTLDTFHDCSSPTLVVVAAQLLRSGKVAPNPTTSVMALGRRLGPQMQTAKMLRTAAL